MVRHRRPHLTLCLIARNAAATLPRCLASAAGVADELVVADTGSADGTAGLARDWGARVLRAPWRGSFSAARNRTLAAARGEWVLILDADEELHPDDRAVLLALLASDAEGYYLPVHSLLGPGGSEGTAIDWRLSLFRNRPGYRFHRRIHEEVESSIRRRYPGARLVHGQARIRHYGYAQDAAGARRKAGRNLRILERERRDRPRDPFVAYALAAEWLALDDSPRALAELRRAEALGGWAAGWAPDLARKLATCLLQAGQPEAAARVLEQARQRFPAYTDLLFLLGAVRVRQGDPAAAAACYRGCLALGPPPPGYFTCDGVGSHRAHAALGALAAQAGAHLEAAGHYAAALPGHPQPGLILGALMASLACLPCPDATAWLARAFDLTDAATANALAAAAQAQGAVGLAAWLQRQRPGP